MTTSLKWLPIAHRSVNLDKVDSEITTSTNAEGRGFFAGVFSATRCVVERYRAQNDFINASVAGAVVGAMVAIRTRSLKQAAGLFALLAIVGAAAEYTKIV